MSLTKVVVLKWKRKYLRVIIEVHSVNISSGLAKEGKVRSGQTMK